MAVADTLSGEQLVSNHRGDARQQRRAYGSIRDIGGDVGSRGFGGIATDGTLDRCNDIVLPEGGDVTAFRTNPVLVNSHDTGSAVNVIGTVPAIWLANNQWRFRGRSCRCVS